LTRAGVSLVYLGLAAKTGWSLAVLCKKRKKEKKKIMMNIVASNVVASRPADGTPTAMHPL